MICWKVTTNNYSSCFEYYCHFRIDATLQFLYKLYLSIMDAFLLLQIKPLYSTYQKDLSNSLWEPLNTFWAECYESCKFSSQRRAKLQMESRRKFQVSHYALWSDGVAHMLLMMIDSYQVCYINLFSCILLLCRRKYWSHAEYGSRRNLHESTCSRLSGRQKMHTSTVGGVYWSGFCTDRKERGPNCE